VSICSADQLISHGSIANVKFIASTWSDEDPSMISSTVLKSRRQLELILCPSQEHVLDCLCEKLRSLYGRGLFNCDRYRCQYFHIGFETRLDRDSHLRIHDRPFKCSVPNCEFAGIGFISNDDLMRHMSKIHHTPLSVVNVASKLPDDIFKQLDLISLLQDAVRADEIEFVRSHYPRAKKLAEWDWHPKNLTQEAAKTASTTMVDFLLAEYCLTNNPDANIKELALESAINGRNTIVIQHLIAQGANVNSKNIFIIRAGLRTFDPEIMELLLSHGANLVESPDLFSYLLCNKKKEEGEILQILDRMHKYIIGKEAYSQGYIYSIHRVSIVLVKYFLDNGVDIDYKKGVYSPLFDLVKEFSRNKIQLIIFLLQKGINPYPSNSQGKLITTLSGMGKLESYIGKSWDDLVRETQAGGAAQ
jgi:hypothetical protein